MERTQSVQKRLHPHLNLNRRAVESMSIPTIGPEILVAGSDGNLQEVCQVVASCQVVTRKGFEVSQTSGSGRAG